MSEKIKVVKNSMKKAKKKLNGKNATGRPTKLTKSINPINLKYSRTMKGSITNIFSNINKRCRRKGWEENDKKGIKERSQQIRQMDKNKNIIAVFSSCRKAMSKTKVEHISHVCNGLRRTAGGYLWEYV